MSMTRNDVIRNIDAALQNGVPYATYLSDAVGRMNPNQLAYFCDHVAPYYMEGPGKNSMACKDMEYMARAVLQDKDVRSVLGINYRELNSRLNGLPSIQPQQTYSYEQSQAQRYEQRTAARSEQEIFANINTMINRYVWHTHTGGDTHVNKTDKFYAQSANVVHHDLPTQGWKFHISARDLADYERLLSVALPEFDKLGVSYKVTKPESFEEHHSKSQAYKDITIYPTPSFDINNFSPELRSVLLDEQSPMPGEDALIQGRIGARYGKFRGEAGASKESLGILSAPDGKLVADTRGVSFKPDFVSEMYPQEILGFYSDCARRYQETGDFKRYLQEAATMTKSDGRSNSYMTLEVIPGYEKQLQSVVSRDPQSMSIIYNCGGKSYALVHNDYASQAVDVMRQMGLRADYFRPEWDKRFDIYQIHPNDINKSVAMVNAYNVGRDLENGAPEMSYMYLDDGSFAIKVDTTLNRDFCEQCIENQIRVADFQINRSEMELNQQVAEQYWERPGDLSQDGQSFFHQGGDLETHAPVIGE